MSKYNKTILIELNGVRADVLRRLARENKLPNIHKNFIERGQLTDFIGYAGGNPQSITAAVLTGKHPMELDVASIPRFLQNRKTIEKKRIKLSGKLKQEKILLYNDFENPLNIYSERPNENSNLGFIERKKRNWVLNYARKHHHWEMLDRSAAKTLIKMLNKDNDFYHITFYSQGKAAASKNDTLERIEFNFDLLDYNIGLIFDALKAKGLDENTLVIMFGNAAQGQLNNIFDLAAFLGDNKIETGVKNSTIKNSHDALCIQTGKSLASLYLKPESNNWHDQSTFQGNSGLKSRISNLLINRQEVDQVMYRIDADKVKVDAKWGSSILSWGNNRLYYEVVRGNDPFNLNSNKNSWSIDESFDITWKSRYPDVLWQVQSLFDIEFSGDMIINAKRGYSFSSNPEKTKRSGGSLNTDHLLIPLLINRRNNPRVRRPNDIRRLILRLTEKIRDDRSRSYGYSRKKKGNPNRSGPGRYQKNTVKAGDRNRRKDGKGR